MGGRRSRPIFQIIQKTPKSEKKISDLADSIKKQDIGSIAEKSSLLFSDVFDFAESFIYTHRLFEEIKEKYRKKITIPPKQLEQTIRKEWTVFKKKNYIKISRAAEFNIIHAVSKAFKEGESS